MLRKEKILNIEIFNDKESGVKISHTHNVSYKNGEIDTDYDEFNIVSGGSKMTLYSIDELKRVYRAMNNYIIEKGISLW